MRSYGPILTVEYVKKTLSDYNISRHTFPDTQPHDEYANAQKQITLL